MSNKDKFEQIQIAVDGPAGAGKSSVSKEVAQKLGIDYLDTGAMYRAAAYFMLANNVDVDDVDALAAALDNVQLDYNGGVLCLNGKELADEIRSAEVTKMATRISALPPVRAKLVAMQREIAKTKSIILDGRDIGTNVLKDANLKIFLTATPEARADRRYKEFIEVGNLVSYAELLDEIKKRDAQDENRQINPLRCADDAIRLDSSNMSKDEVVDFIVKKVEELVKK